MSDLTPTDPPPPPQHGTAGRIYVAVLLLTAITTLLTTAGSFLGSLGGDRTVTQVVAPSSPQQATIQQTINISVAAPNMPASGAGEVVSPAGQQKRADETKTTTSARSEEQRPALPVTSPFPQSPAPMHSQPSNALYIPNQRSAVPNQRVQPRSSGGDPLTGARIELIRETNPIGDPLAAFDRAASTSFDFVAKSDRPAIKIVFPHRVTLNRINYKNPPGKLLDHIVPKISIEAETAKGTIRRILHFDIYREGPQGFDVSIDDVEALVVIPEPENFGRRYSLGTIVFE